MEYTIEIVDADESVTPATVGIPRIYNLGSATRLRDDAVAHQEEVGEIGISIAFDVPAPRIYPMSTNSVTTADSVAVHHEFTSGEAEIVLIVDRGELLVGVGSDHTDRRLERESIIWSKQYCASVMGTRFWRWSDIESDWDEFRLTSEVDGRLYQDSLVSFFMSPPGILDILKQRVIALPESYMVFCGTAAALDRQIRYGASWAVELSDPSRHRSVRKEYSCVNLMHELSPEFRVPVFREQ